MSESTEPKNSARRSFFKEASALAIGGIVGLTPVAAGLAVLMDPLRREGEAGKLIRITTLDALPNDGLPRKYPVLASRVDAWNRFPDSPVGAIYLRRTGEKTVEALNVVCPHAGCFVDLKGGGSSFFCPCHNSTFGLDGKIADPKSPSPRGMDSLDVEIRNEKEIWVRFQNFRTGEGEKIPVT
jgi:menaquinol-cytochrome c reductase iron-sulfur subunit